MGQHGPMGAQGPGPGPKLAAVFMYELKSTSLDWLIWAYRPLDQPVLSNSLEGKHEDNEISQFVAVIAYLI